MPRRGAVLPPRRSVHAAAVADAGGLLVLAGLLEGTVHEVEDVLALDATSLLVAEYLVLRHEGASSRARAEFGLASRVVSEWFPVRVLAMDAAIAATSRDLDGSVALALAESLNLPLMTKNRELASDKVAVLPS